MGAQGVIHRTPTPRDVRPPAPCWPHHLGTKSPDHTVAPAPRRANATWYIYEVSAQRAASVGVAEGSEPVVVGGKCTHAHRPAATLRPRRVCYDSCIDVWCGRVPVVTPRPRQGRPRPARRERRARSLNVHGRPQCTGAHPPAKCLQRRSECDAPIHAPMSSPVSPPPTPCRLRRRSRAAEPASPTGGLGGERWERLVAPPLEQLARVHAVACSIWLPSHPY